VVSQFQTSVHYTEYLANVSSAAPEAEWTTPGAPCGNCHAIDALAQRLAGTVGTLNDAGVTNLASGELEYLDPALNMVESASYTGSATVAEVYCTTCHAVTNANDPHRTGLPWTPGSFPLQVPTGATNEAFIEKSPTLTATTGSSAGALGAANTCVWCHKSRVDVTTYITASNVLTSPYWGPHEGPQADIFSAKGGYQFAGQTYGTSTHQLELTCVDCHMPDVAENSGVANHSFEPQLSVCLNCHMAATSFDVNGGQSLITKGMLELQAALNNAGFLTRSTAAPYAPLSGTNLTDDQFPLDQVLPGGGPDGGATTLTANQAGALYDYILVARGGALGVHNPTYVQQIVYDSITAITNKAPISIPRPL
jgi:hypothetical protein